MDAAPTDGRTTWRAARRYLPLAVAVGVQVLLVATFPSVPVGSPRERFATRAFEPADSVGSDADVVGTDALPGAGVAVPQPSAPNDDRRSTPRAATRAAAVPPSGSTAHCVGDRQFDPAIDPHAPSCRPAFTGDNGGATAPGVTDEEILLVDYYIDPGPALSTILRESDTYATEDQQTAFDDAAERFINEHFELYGRRVRIETWRSPCSISPPEEACFRADAADLVASKKPFAVVSNLPTPIWYFYDELSKRGTLNLGGWQFRDEFSAARRPYHWDPNISGTRMANTFADWYCGQLHGRPVQYAGEPRPPSESFNGRPRVLGVVALNEVETKAVVTDVLEPALARCGAEVARTFFIEPNVATASAQNHAAIEKLREPPEVTSLLCICGPPMAFSHRQMQEENYYPEQLMPGNSTTDLDSVAQFFTGSLGCPSRRDCQAENMFGLAQLAPQEPRLRGVGSRIWRAGGGQGVAPYPRVDIDWTYWSMLATLIQAAGPALTPHAIEQAAPTIPATGGGTTGQPLRQFRGDSYGWIRDMRVVYWSMTKTSAYNGQPGTWVQIGGRFEPGSAPVDALVLPPKPR